LAIAGLGVAWVDTARFEALLRRHGDRPLVRLFTDDERAYAAARRRGHESLAVRLAAKLAARRALGADGIRLREIEVVRTRGDAPSLRFHGSAARAAARLGVVASSLSLTHDAVACVGQVILECTAPGSRALAERDHTRTFGVAPVATGGGR
jgi:holo-[acyl-carrier protein] synthase